MYRILEVYSIMSVLFGLDNFIYCGYYLSVIHFLHASNITFVDLG